MAALTVHIQRAHRNFKLSIQKIVSRGNTAKIYNRVNELIAVPNKVNNLNKVNTVLENKQTYVTENVSNGISLKEKFHRVLVHVNDKYMF